MLLCTRRAAANPLGSSDPSKYQAAGGLLPSSPLWSVGEAISQPVTPVVQTDQDNCFVIGCSQETLRQSLRVGR